MATVNAKAFRVTESSREILQCFIVEEIPEDTKFVLASSEGYLFFNEEIPLITPGHGFRVPTLTMLSYFDIEYESE
jgi:hypothetical protein